MKKGLPGFRDLLKEFRRLALWGAGGAAVPFAAQLVSLSPPWPKGIVAITSTVELVTLVFVYQFLRESNQRTINRVLGVAAAALAIAGSTYLIVNSMYTFEVPTTKDRFVKGYVCTANARIVYKAKCPDLDIDDLAGAGYEADRLWTEGSITTVRFALDALWLGTFIALSGLLGAFVVYQSQVPARAAGPVKRPPAKGAAKSGI
ncbi:MAG TPA: hypothetical protein VKB79_09445 [Bryobacteraceae bacterium]|nr:hypothetical protein [Bryobacteraceae bacterium]